MHGIAESNLVRRAGWRAGLALIVCLLFSLVAMAAEIPALTGRVVDAANMISAADEAKLVARLEAFEKRSSDQIVVATIDTLDGEAIEPYANRMFRTWGLGQAGENNGVLLLVVKNDRKMRIEVGYGLEGTMTDLYSGLIIQDMVTRFRAGDFSGGIVQAAEGIEKVLSGQPEELEARARRNPQSSDSGIDPIITLFILLWVCLFFGSMAMAILPRMYGEKIAPGRYRWMGMEFNYAQSDQRRNAGRTGSSSGWSSGGSSWSSGGSSWSSGGGGGGFSGGGGSSGGGGASGSW